MTTEVPASPNADAPGTDDAATAATASTATNDAAATTVTDAAATAAATGTDAAKAKDDTQGKAPEQYEAFKMPEGAALDSEIMGEFSAAAKEFGLTQEQAQRLADIGGKSALKSKGALDTALSKARTEWAEQSKTDKEFGGEKFDENLATANLALSTYGTPALKSFLDDSGLGNHPEMLRWAFKVGKSVSADKIVTGRQPGTGAVGWHDHPTSPKSV